MASEFYLQARQLQSFHVNLCDHISAGPAEGCVLSMSRCSLPSTVSFSLSFCLCISSACLLLALIAQHSCQVVHPQRQKRRNSQHVLETKVGSRLFAKESKASGLVCYLLNDVFQYRPNTHDAEAFSSYAMVTGNPANSSGKYRAALSLHNAASKLGRQYLNSSSCQSPNSTSRAQVTGRRGFDCQLHRFGSSHPVGKADPHLNAEEAVHLPVVEGAQ